jgi:hypothetical protein
LIVSAEAFAVKNPGARPVAVDERADTVIVPKASRHAGLALLREGTIVTSLVRVLKAGLNNCLVRVQARHGLDPAVAGAACLADVRQLLLGERIQEGFHREALG